MEITTYHLEMTDPAELRPGRGCDATGLEVRPAEVPSPALGRFLYGTVGDQWCWLDRLPWSDEQWMERLSRPEVEIWVGYLRGTPVGYFELEAQPGGSVELVYFGLFPQFVGQGLGGCLLTEAVRRGWRDGTRRVWVHTCTLDHPGALANYRSRGFRLFRTETAPATPAQLAWSAARADAASSGAPGQPSTTTGS